MRSEYIYAVGKSRGKHRTVEPKMKHIVWSVQSNLIAQQICKVGANVLSSCCNYRVNVAHPLRSKNCPTVEICIVEIVLQWSVEAL